jgi:hypothetical protein
MATTEKAYDEIVNLFARGTTPQQILQFHPSEQSQTRVRHLLSRVKSGEITSDESAELERLGQLEHMMQLIKARARNFEAR